MDKQILYYYQKGVASYLIAKKFGISNSQVRHLIEKSGIKLRGHDITNKVSAKKRTPEENKQITRAASRANRGSEHTIMHRSRLAISRQNNPAIDPVYEQPLVDLCKKLGICVIPQKAFYRYNVDLYFVKENVVVEIFGGGFHSKQVAIDMFNNKIKYLSNRQIPVVVVWADKLTYNPKSVISVVCAVNKKLTVVNGDGTPTSRGLLDILVNN
jgi:very-short-patch-repair endonuclease